jgi:hypothetical protein
MLRLAIVSPKGGVGKSTIAYYLSKELSKRYRVILVDRDLTATISSIFGIKIGILNYLTDNVQGSFVHEEGNLKVISMARYQPTEVPNMDNFYPIYKTLLDGADILITDNPPGGISELEIMEYKAYYKARGEVHSYFVAVSTPGLVLERTLNFLGESAKILKHMVPELSFVKTIALVINMSKESLQGLSGINVIAIPFYRDLLYKGFQNCDPPKETHQLVKVIEPLVSEAQGMSERNVS